MPGVMGRKLLLIHLPQLFLLTIPPIQKTSCVSPSCSHLLTFGGPKGLQQEMGLFQNPLFDGALPHSEISQGCDGKPAQLFGSFTITEGNP